MMVLDDLRQRWVSEARADGRQADAAALEGKDMSSVEDMSAFGDMSLSAARASQAIEHLHERDPDDDQPHPWRRSS